MLRWSIDDKIEEVVRRAHELLYDTDDHRSDPVVAPRVRVDQLEGTQSDFRVLVRIRGSVWPVAPVFNDDFGQPAKLK